MPRSASTGLASRACNGCQFWGAALRRTCAANRWQALPHAARHCQPIANPLQDVLATMTPPEYSAIRPYLARSSGFQSWQYRCIEFSLGNKSAAMLTPHAHAPARLAEVEAAWRAPSIYDEALRLLARRGLAVPASHTQRDWTQPYAASAAVEQAWLVAYRAPEAHWDLYQLGEELTDLEDAFRLWRFRHLTTVTRIIGMKTGTGGTSGAAYLKRMLEVELFPELWQLRTDL